MLHLFCATTLPVKASLILGKTEWLLGRNRRNTSLNRKTSVTFRKIAQKKWTLYTCVQHVAFFLGATVIFAKVTHDMILGVVPWQLVLRHSCAYMVLSNAVSSCTDFQACLCVPCMLLAHKPRVSACESFYPLPKCHALGLVERNQHSFYDPFQCALG